MSAVGNLSDGSRVFPLEALIAFTGESLHYPLDSLPNLLEYVRQRCSNTLASRRPILCPEFFADPKPVQVILKGLGYLSQAPLLRILIFHLVCKSRAFDSALELLDLLRRDVKKIFMTLESSLRQILLCGTKTKQENIVEHVERIAAFTLSMRHVTGKKLERLKRNGPRPALLIVPSEIAIANYGLYLRGKVGAGEKIAGYCGEVEESDSDGSGYRMMIGTTVVDAKVERCLCSMMNDPRHSLFKRNVRFSESSALKRVVGVTICKVEDEELYVSYGTNFSLDFEGTAASFSRSLAPDFITITKTCTLPGL